ncbi:MAG: hypothetical protein LV473_03290 [Nitrospira sp.]|nr:hypothetical protein [Nitrospira sp.]
MRLLQYVSPAFCHARHHLRHLGIALHSLEPALAVQLVDAVATALTKSGGDNPFHSTRQAIVVTAREKDGVD